MMTRRCTSHIITILVGVSLAVAGCGGDFATGKDGDLMRWGDDLLGGSSSLSIADSIPGDVMIGGGELTFSGFAGGDYLGAGGQQNIGGRVAGSVRAAGGQVMLTGEVRRNVTLAGGQITIGEASVIRGNAYVVGGKLRIAGTIEGSVRAGGQNVELDGTVTGDVDARGTSLRVGPNARISGDLTYAVAADSLTIDPGAVIGGQVLGHQVSDGGGGPSFRVLHLLWMLGFIVAGLVAVALFPRAANATESSLRVHPAAALGFGLLLLLIVPIAMAMLALTGIGLPLAAIIGGLYLIAVYLSRGVVAVWIGRKMLRDREKPGRAGVVTAFLIGSAILFVLTLIPIVGIAVLFVATILGLGSLAVAVRERRSHRVVM